MRLTAPASWRRRVADFDNRVDEAFGKLRGNRTADRLFYGASAVGDHGMLWMFIAGVRALSPHYRPAARRAAIGVIVESVVVNIGVKSLFRRRRPVDHSFIRPHHLRIPLTSSFPSGHATSAFTAATLLSENDPMAPAYYAAAVVIATSRVYVKIHHASDVLGGVALGLVMGRVARRLFPLESHSS